MLACFQSCSNDDITSTESKESGSNDDIASTECGTEAASNDDITSTESIETASNDEITSTKCIETASNDGITFTESKEISNDCYTSTKSKKIDFNCAIGISVRRSKGPCILTGDKFDISQCVVMSCSHAIDPDMLYDMCNTEVYSNKKWEIHCPSCNKVWPVDEILKCGVTQAEIQKLVKECQRTGA